MPMCHLGEEETMLSACAKWRHSRGKLWAHPPVGQGDRY
jgi:hypothetical protein